MKNGDRVNCDDEAERLTKVLIFTAFFMMMVTIVGTGMDYQEMAKIIVVGNICFMLTNMYYPTVILK
jgi:hypothetical protein